MIELRPQPGPQEAFLSSPAFIAIYGGAAGGGKSFAITLEPLRHLSNPVFGAVVFRKTYKQITQPGGLLDEAEAIYPLLGASFNIKDMKWTFDSGMKVSYSYLSSPTDHLQYQGAQIPLICFDELTHFTEKQFFYMMSRARSGSGVPGYIRATCNPDSESWVADFISWWIGDDGFPIKERAGKLRWFIRKNDDLIWGNSVQELKDKYGEDVKPKSATFIPALLSDNKILMEKDPEYQSNLEALSEVERAQLLDGNWKIKPSAGMYFKEERFNYIDENEVPQLKNTVRYWDRAATPKTATNDPDWTAGVLMGQSTIGDKWYVLDVERFQEDPAGVLRKILKTAERDGKKVTQCLEQDPGQAGKVEASYLASQLAGYPVKTIRVSKDKLTRALPVSGQSLAGNVYLVRNRWNKPLITELEAFSGGNKGHDDQVDALSGAFNELTTKQKKVFIGRA